MKRRRHCVDDVMKFMTSQHGNVTHLRYVVLKTVL